MTTPVHLTDAELTAALLAEADARTQAHLAACAVCTRELAQVQGGLAGYRQDRLRAAERPDADWEAQRAQIHQATTAAPTAVDPARSAPTRAWTWRAALTAAAAGLLLWMAILAPRNSPPPAEEALDDALLVSVQQSLRRGVPAALEPAQFLVTDIGATSAAH